MTEGCPDWPSNSSAMACQAWPLLKACFACHSPLLLLLATEAETLQDVQKCRPCLALWLPSRSQGALPSCCRQYRLTCCRSCRPIEAWA